MLCDRVPTGIMQRGLAVRLAETVCNLIQDKSHTLESVQSTLQDCLGDWAALGIGERRLGRVLQHLLFQLGDGDTVFESCSVETNSWLASTLIVERVAHTEDGLQKVVARLAHTALPADPNAFHEYIEGPSIVVYNNSVVQADEPAPALGQNLSAELTEHELHEYFSNRQAIATGIERLRADGEDAFMQHQKDIDRAAIRAGYEAVLRCQETLLTADSVRQKRRSSHPYRKPCLHILPRLLRAPAGCSILRYLTEQLPSIVTMGFGGILLGVVDRQSIGVFIGDERNGRLTPYVNNHGYWSSGEQGIDPLLGTTAEYTALVARAAALGITFMQDSVVGTLGYPAQVRRFSQSTLAQPERCVILGEHAVDICDPRLFLHEVCIDEDESLTDDASPEHYAAVVLQGHLGSPFALPKPNLYRPEVRTAMLQRLTWQLVHGGTRSFRIDMAKHVGIQPLRELIGAMRDAVAADARSGQQEFSVLLEYWTVNYRDLQFAATVLEEQSAGAYLYDFPLARALQQILICDGHYAQQVQWLLAERAQWGIDLTQLIPVFIDHDFNFRPIYNGSAFSAAMVINGYALAAMLSANGCYAYLGFQDAQAGVPDLARYFDFTEQHARRANDHLFSADPGSPAPIVAELFAALAHYGVLEHWDGVAPQCEGDADHLLVTRRCQDPASGETLLIQARFWRGALHPLVTRDEWTPLFAWYAGPSVTIEARHERVPPQGGKHALA